MTTVTTDTPKRAKISQQAVAPWLFLLPAFLFFATYVLYPIFQSFYISLYEWNGLYSPQYRGVEGSGLTDQACLELGNRAGREEGCELTGDTVWNAEYVGMENYANLYNDPFFWTSLKNNAIWLVLYFLAIPGGLMISLFLNQKVFGMRLYKSLFFFPFVLSQVVVGLVFSWFMLPGADEGLLNVILGWFGAGPVNILGNNNTATYGIIAAGLWPQTAYCMILYLTGLNAVDPEQIEAARLDGAKGPKMLWYVVLPQLWPATFIAIVVTVIGALRSFDLITIMTNGGPGFYNTSVLAFYMYDVALSEFGFRMGYGSAIAVILFLIMMVYIAGFLWKMWRVRRFNDMFPRPIEHYSPAARIGYQLLLPFMLLVWLIPLLAVMWFSVKSGDDFTQGNYWGWSESGLQGATNYWMVFAESDMPRYLWNSVVITVPTMLGAVALSCMTGFALGVYRFKGNLLIFFMFVAGNFVPFQILMVPVRDLTDQMGLYDTRAGLILFHIAFQTGFCTLFMRNFIRALPRELIEAARVEGVSEYRIFWYVVLPLMRPAIAALCVLIFTFIWNDFFWAVVLTQSPESQPVTAGITAFNAQFRAMYHMMSAGSIVAAIPPVAMFFLMQKHFIAGLTLGAVK